MYICMYIYIYIYIYIICMSCSFSAPRGAARTSGSLVCAHEACNACMHASITITMHAGR